MNNDTLIAWGIIIVIAFMMYLFWKYGKKLLSEEK